LVDLSGFSLEDLSVLDDSVVAGVIRDLVLRRRCAAESSSRFNAFQAAI